MAKTNVKPTKKASKKRTPRIPVPDNQKTVRQWQRQRASLRHNFRKLKREAEALRVERDEEQLLADEINRSFVGLRRALRVILDCSYKNQKGLGKIAESLEDLIGIKK